MSSRWSGTLEPTDDELEAFEARQAKIDAMVEAGVYHVEAVLLQEDLDDLEAGRPSKPPARAPKRLGSA